MPIPARGHDLRRARRRGYGVCSERAAPVLLVLVLSGIFASACGARTGIDAGDAGATVLSLVWSISIAPRATPVRPRMPRGCVRGAPE